MQNFFIDYYLLFSVLLFMKARSSASVISLYTLPVAILILSRDMISKVR